MDYSELLHIIRERSWSEIPDHSIFQFIQLIIWRIDVDTWYENRDLMKWAMNDWKRFK